MTTTENDGRFAFWLTVLGFVTALAAFGYLWLAPTYSTGETLAEVNGGSVVLALAFPVVAALIVWIGLHAKCSRGSRLGEVAAIVAAGLLAVETLLGMASIGFFLLPAAALLVCAVGVTPRAAPSR